MPKTIVDIELKGLEDVKNLADVMGLYREQLGTMPSDWDKMTRSAAKHGKEVRDQTAALLAQRHMLREQDKQFAEADRKEREHARAVAKEAREKRAEETKDQRQVERGQRETTKHNKLMLMNWRELHRVSGVVKGDVMGMTESLFKFIGGAGTVGAIIGTVGMATVGAMSALMSSASNIRKSAMMMGTTPGEVQAGGALFGRWGDPQAMLSGIASARSDLASRWAYGAVGMPGGWKEEPGKALPELLTLAKRNMGRMTDSQGNLLTNTPMAQAFQTLGIPLETLRALKETDWKELNTAVKEYTDTQKKLNDLMTPQVMMQWSVLNAHIQLAGASIEAAFIKGLAPIAPDMDKLGASIADLIEAFADVGVFKGLGDALSDFAKLIRECAEGLKRFKEFMDMLGLKPKEQEAVNRQLPMSTRMGLGIGMDIAQRIAGKVGLPQLPLTPKEAKQGQQQQQAISQAVHDAVQTGSRAVRSHLPKTGSGAPVEPAPSPTLSFGKGGTTVNAASARIAKIAAQLKKDLGVTSAGAAALISNLIQEGGGVLTGVGRGEIRPTVKGSLGGFGWAQWTGVSKKSHRRKDFFDWAKAQGLDPKSDAANYGYLIHELKSQYAGLVKNLQTMVDPTVGAMTVEHKYEGAGKGIAAHAAHAQQVLTIIVQNPTSAQVAIKAGQLPQ